MRVNLLVLSLFSSLVQGAGRGEYVIQKQFTLGGNGGWDYLTVDSTANRLFISRSDRVLVVNSRDGSLIATIPDTQGVHGIALAPDLGKGFTSNGRSDTVTVFDLKSLKPTGTIEVGGHNPDAILYDEASRQIYTFNGLSRDISVIDPVKAAVIARIPAGRKPEFAAADGKGRIFFNIEDKSQVGAIDSATNKPIVTWSLTNCEQPTGLALDVDHRRLFSVCGNGVLVVTDQKSARTMALDSRTHRVFLVAAQFGAPPAPTADLPHPRPSILDGGFKVLVVGN